MGSSSVVHTTTGKEIEWMMWMRMIRSCASLNVAIKLIRPLRCLPASVLWTYGHSMLYTLQCRSRCTVSSVKLGNNSFIPSKQIYSSDQFHKGLLLASFKFCFFSGNECNSWLSFAIPLLNEDSFHSVIHSWRNTWCWKDTFVSLELLTMHAG